MKTVDVAVVGAGAAGLSAALFLARARRKTIVYDGGPTRDSVVERTHEFFGNEGTTPNELQARGKADVLRYGGEIRAEAVRSIDARADGLFDVVSDDCTVTARAVVLATGLVDILPPVPGLREGWGRDVQVCGCFTGFEISDKRIVVFGLPERLAPLGVLMTAWSKDVTIVAPDQLDAESNARLKMFGVDIVQETVTALERQHGRLVAVTTASRSIPCDTVYIGAAFRAASGLAASLCNVDTSGFAITDAEGRTSKAGVWAIGNATDPIAHIAHSAAAGARVGPWVTLYTMESALSQSRGKSTRSA